MARKRSGSLSWRASGWRAFIRVTEDGKTVRKFVDLETTSKSVAKRKLARLVGKAEAGELPAAAVEAEAVRFTVDDFAKDHYEARSKFVKSWKDERRLYDACLSPVIGDMPLDDVTLADIQKCLAETAATRAHESVKKVRSQASALFRAARAARLTTNNPIEGIGKQKVVRKKLPRAILTDAEFARYVDFPHAVGHRRPPNTIDLEVKVMSIVARTIGGQRGSDVHALTWTIVDLVKFDRMLVRRPKTEHLSDGHEEDTYVVPDVARPYLKAWWEASGCPVEGPIFPARNRTDEDGKARPKGKVSHAHALRRDLRRAFGLEVWDAGKGKYVEADRPMTPRERDLFIGSDRIRPVDFHSHRRSFATGLRRARVDARDAMRLAAHTSYETHQKYVLDDGPIAAPPAAALPMLPAVRPVQRLATGRFQTARGGAKNSNDFVGVRGFEPPTTCTQSAPTIGSGEKTAESVTGSRGVPYQDPGTSDAIGNGSVANERQLPADAAAWETALDATLRATADRLSRSVLEAPGFGDHTHQHST